MKISKEARTAAEGFMNRYAGYDYFEDDRADLAATFQSLINSTLDRASEAARVRMVAQEWPPQDGDQQIDEVLEAILALKEDTQ